MLVWVNKAGILATNLGFTNPLGRGKVPPPLLSCSREVSFVGVISPSSKLFC